MTDIYTNNKEISFDLFKYVAEQFASCMNDNLYVYDIKNDTYYITEGATKRFAVPGSFFNNVLEEHKKFVYPDDFTMLVNDLNQLIRGEKNEHNLLYRWLSKDGSPIWINCRGRLILGSDGRPSIIIGCINEIGKRQNADNVSGLLSAVTLKERLSNYNHLPDGYVLRIGIDDFKIVNERLGQEYSDHLLRNVAECIETNLIGRQSVYRIEGDEFIIFDLNGGTLADAHALFHKIRSGVDKHIEDNNYQALYTISGGVIENSYFETADFEYILKITEFALSTAKLRGKNQLYYFSADDYNAFLRIRMLGIALRESVDNNFQGFELYYQPIVSVDNETLYAAETLLRYTLTTGEKVSPGEFIPILEETGLIVPVGKWIIKGAIATCKEFQEKLPSFHISINLSYIQLLKSPVFVEILETLDNTGLSPDSLIVELTESGQLDNSLSIRNVWDKLKKLGVRLAIDDFGTGYSNLGNINNLKPDIVKLDRSFTIKALQNEYDHQLMIHIIYMIHSIGLNLVVEGIETKDEQSEIAALEPDFIQGYYYSQPCSKNEFRKKFNL